MRVCVPAVLLAAMAVAQPEFASGILSRSTLHSLTVRAAALQCDPKQSLVCCDKTENCATIDMGSKYNTTMLDILILCKLMQTYVAEVSHPELLHEQCNAKVACCDLGDTSIHKSKNVRYRSIISGSAYANMLEQWGDISESCNFLGNLSH